MIDRQIHDRQTDRHSHTTSKQEITILCRSVLSKNAFDTQQHGVSNKSWTPHQPLLCLALLFIEPNASLSCLKSPLACPIVLFNSDPMKPKPSWSLPKSSFQQQLETKPGALQTAIFRPSIMFFSILPQGRLLKVCAWSFCFISLPFHPPPNILH